MPIKYDCSYLITEPARKRFKRWLADNDLTIASFSRKCDVSRQYISRVINGNIKITPSVVKTFKAGGYDLI